MHSPELADVDDVRILATVTLNPNQLRAHLEPILDLPEVEEVVLVTDVAPPPLPKVRTVIPPRLLRSLLGRAGSKLVVSCLLARRTRPRWVIGLHLVPHGINAVLAAAFARTRSVYVMIGGREWLEGGWRSDNNVLGRLRRPSPALERLLLGFARRATVTVTMGTRTRDALLTRGFDPARVQVIPGSVDESRFHPRNVERVWDVISVAELIKTKRLHDVLDAIGALALERPHVRAAIVGRGPLQSFLAARAEQAGIGANVSLLGFRDDVDELYARARVFVLPSESEGLSIAMMEAMATGLPVVVSDVGSARDVVRHGENGFLYPAGDVQALTHYLELLLGDPELCRRLGAAGARDVHAHASPSVIAERFRELLCRFSDASEP